MEVFIEVGEGIEEEEVMGMVVTTVVAEAGGREVRTGEEGRGAVTTVEVAGLRFGTGSETPLANVGAL